MNIDNEKTLKILGWIATITAISMYVSYFPQIKNNLEGNKGDWLQPLVAGVNCVLWVSYGILKNPKKDWPIIIANLPGVVFGFFAFFTALK